MTYFDQDLITGIYEAATQPDKWRPVLDELCRRTGAEFCNLLLFDDVVPNINVNAASSLITQPLLQEYGQKWGALEGQAIQRIRGFEPFTFIEDVDTIEGRLNDYPPTDWFRTRLGTHRRIAARLNNFKTWHDQVSFNFADGRGQMTSAERRVARGLFPHLAKALDLGRVFARTEGLVSRLMEAVAHGVFIALADGSLVRCNSEGLRQLEEARSLTLRHGRLTTRSRDHGGQLARGIEECSITAEGRGRQSEIKLVLPCRSGLPYFVEIAPLCEPDDHIRAALIFSVDPNRPYRIDTTKLADCHGLTPAESQICQLTVDGLTQQQIADLRGVKPQTVRSQLRKVYENTGIEGHGREAQLVRLAFRTQLPIQDLTLDFQGVHGY